MKAGLGAVLAAGLLITSLLSGALGAPVAETASLRPTFGGVLLEAHLLPGSSSSLTGVWSDAGHAKLLRCAPRCQVVSEIPLSGPLTISQSSAYRVVLGGTFKPGKRVKVLLRFGQAELVAVEATVMAR
ncbi:hypothetical protein DKM44_11925 [Deinococcus irradiatisoli]|uniref:Uncharacterized protein n=1 Tax=Deinococcus irradiatisoli TaxID=2202254 RepID=A0A2Z3JR36_9DEIO|nr:hypothetical protein [Deinococcus irradiatisoli]AWN23848.1 hypothetical protein DKM44_11925 [Deinococcus irradiatisoli]